MSVSRSIGLTMKKLPLRRAAIGLVMVAALALPGLAWGGGGPAYQAGATATPPTIDGSLAPGEWADATAYSFTLGSPSFGSIPATARFEQTATDLYVAVVVQDVAPGATPSLGVYFDNNHDGIKNAGDDLWLDFVGSAGQDFFWDPASGSAGSNVADPGGGDDTIASSTKTSGAVTFEFRHPLCSGDLVHDICATPGQLLGVDFQYESGTAPGVFYDGPGPSTLDPSITWGDLQLAAAPPTTCHPRSP